MVQTTAMQWLVTGRESIVTEIVQGLKPQGAEPSTAGIGRGILLTGEIGIGKSHLAAEAMKCLQPELHVVRLHARAHMSNEPFGALAGFLWGEGLEGSHRSVRVLAATRRRLESMVESKGVCFLVDNANELDSHSAVILAQLARAGNISLLLTCGASNPLHRELADLVKDGYVRKLQVEPFSFLEAVKALESRLGGTLSRLAGRKLWRASGGNPLYLGVLSDQMKKSGALVSRAGTWCLDESVAEEARIPAETFANQLRRLTASEGRTMEIVALARGISLGILVALVDGQDIDALEGRGLVSIDSVHIVKVCSPLLARVVRSRVPTGRSEALLEEVRIHQPMVHESTASEVGMATWSLECGRPVGDYVALAAARTANDRKWPRLALELLASNASGVTLSAVVAEKIRAHMILGELCVVQEALKSYHSAEHDEPTLSDWVAVLLAETSLLVSSKDAWAEAEANLEKIRTELYPDAHDCGVVPTGGNIVALRGQLALARVQSAWWTGNFSAAIDELAHWLMADGQHEGGNALLLGSQLSLVAAASGDIGKALELADGLVASLNTVPADSATEAGPRELLFFSYLIAGRLDAAEDLARGFYRQMAEDVAVHGTAFSDLALPILSAARGHGGQCLHHLMPELAQLRLQDHDGALGLALSAAAYASALSGDMESAGRYLAELDGYHATAPWLAERFGLYFELTTRSMLGDSNHSVTQLLCLSDADKNSGRNHWEMVSLGLALKLGETGVAERLWDAAGQFVVGPCSFYQAMAEGTLKSDAGLLALAADLAAGEGNDAGVVEAAEASMALGTLDPSRHRSLDACLERSRRNMEISSRRAGDGQPLTARQMEIAALAANGASNKDIAAGLHVSIRTVEGHLYQIFGKLRISERSDLKHVLDQLVGDVA